MGRMGPALWFIAELYKVEDRAAAMTAADRLCLRQIESKPILDQLHGYLQKIQAEVLPKSPEGRAVRYTLNNWVALTRYCEDGGLSIDNNATERDIRGVAVGRNYVQQEIMRSAAPAGDRLPAIDGHFRRAA